MEGWKDGRISHASANTSAFRRVLCVRQEFAVHGFRPR